MSELSSKAVAQFHLAESEKYERLSKFHRDMADSLSVSGPIVPMPLPMLQTGLGSLKLPVISVQELNTALAKKAGRLAHVAKRLHTTDDAIKRLLSDPHSNFEIGERGFIYTKEEVAKQKAKRGL